jgi:hypothetical protein
MNLRIKTVLVLTATFIAGVVIGALISGTIRRQHINRVFQMREPAGFVGFAEEIIRPTDAQKDTVQKILIENHKRILDIRTRHMKDLSAQMDSLNRRLKSVLTREQAERLSRFEGRMNPGGKFGRPPFSSAKFMRSLLPDMQDRLKLTDEQAEKVADILSHIEEPEERGGPGAPGPALMPGGPDGRMPMMKDRMKKIDAEIEEILTSEQKVEFEKFRMERKNWMRPPGP